MRVRAVRAGLEVEPPVEPERADLDRGVRLDVAGEQRVHDAVVLVERFERLGHAGIDAPLGGDRVLPRGELDRELLEHRRAGARTSRSASTARSDGPCARRIRPTPARPRPPPRTPPRTHAGRGRRSRLACRRCPRARGAREHLRACPRCLARPLVLGRGVDAAPGSAVMRWSCPTCRRRTRSSGSRTTPTRSSVRSATRRTSCSCRTRSAAWSGRSWRGAGRSRRSSTCARSCRSRASASASSSRRADEPDAARSRAGGMVDDQGRSHWARPGGDDQRCMYRRPRARGRALGRSSGCSRRRSRSQGEPSPEPPAGLRVESIVGTEDRVVSPDWSRRVARERLGVEPVEIPDGPLPDDHPPRAARGRLAQLDAE